MGWGRKRERRCHGQHAMTTFTWCLVLGIPAVELHEASRIYFSCFLVVTQWPECLDWAISATRGLLLCRRRRGAALGEEFPPTAWY